MRRPSLLALALATLLLGPASAQQPVVPYSQNSAGQHPAPVQWVPVLLAGLTATVVSVVSSQPAHLAYIYCYNPSGAAAYLQIFDVATAAGVTIGVTSPKLSLGIPTLQASGFGPGVVGVQFKNGIQVASTTTATGSSTATMNCNAAYSN